MGLLEGQVAFITGASRGIGRAIAIAFAKEGARIGASARNEEQLAELSSEIRDMDGVCVTASMDLRSEESIKAAVNKFRTELGPTDLLVNNAAVIELSTITNTTTEAWDNLMDTNIRGLFITCREVLPQMMDRKSGRIINISSMAGRRGYPEQGAYCASKHALVGLSKVLAIETQEYGIRVHMLSPGGVLTGLSSDLRASRGESEESPDWMTSEEVAEAALYLCSQTGAAFTDELVLRRFASEPWR